MSCDNLNAYEKELTKVDTDNSKNVDTEQKSTDWKVGDEFYEFGSCIKHVIDKILFKEAEIDTLYISGSLGFTEKEMLKPEWVEKPYFYYVRNEKTRHPKALVCILLDTKFNIGKGVARCNTDEDDFLKKEARKIAERRARFALVDQARAYSKNTHIPLYEYNPELNDYEKRILGKLVNYISKRDRIE